MFRLTDEEFRNLKFQFGMSSWGGTASYRGPSRNRAWRCCPVCCEVAAQYWSTSKSCAHSCACAEFLPVMPIWRAGWDELEGKYDAQFKVVFDAIRRLMTSPKPEPEKPKRQIGFQVSDAKRSHKR